MASARIADDTPAPPPPKKVILEMTMEEARVLRGLTGSVCGSPDWREQTNAVYEALKRAGAGDANGLQKPDGSYLLVNK